MYIYYVYYSFSTSIYQVNYNATSYITVNYHRLGLHKVMLRSGLGQA